MKTKNERFGFGQKVLVLAIASAFAPGAFAEDDLSEYTQPSSSFSVGVGGLSGDSKERSIFGQYNGLRQENAVGLVDIDFVRRDETTGTWTTFQGTNLGLDTREISFGLQKQGDWKIGLDYDELTHREIRTINTGNSGVGTVTPTVSILNNVGTVPAGSVLAGNTVPIFGNGADVDLKLRRIGTSLVAEKWLSPSLLFEVNFKNEDKDGARMSGKGYACSGGRGTDYYICQNSGLTSAILMQAEPVNYNTKQLDMKLVLSGEKFNGQVGYYGSFFSNQNGSTNTSINGTQLFGGIGTLSTMSPAATDGIYSNPTYGYSSVGASLKTVLQMPFALPPDNQAHQLFTSGTYAFSNSTKGNFKASYTHLTQNDSFAGMGLGDAPAGASSLNAEVNTMLVQLGLSSKPFQKLSLNANLRYEDRDDKTPRYRYNVERDYAPWFNSNTSASKLSGKLEATYQLPEDFRATIGVDYKEHKRTVVSNVEEERVAGIGVLRAKTEETNYRVELSKLMSETLTGSISYISGYRRGSDWTSLLSATYGQTMSAAQIVAASPSNPFPISMADINREKFKIAANWEPIESLSVQFLVEHGSDRNVTPGSETLGSQGTQKTGNILYSVDATYAISDNWKVTGYAAHGRQSFDFNRAASSTGSQLRLDNDSDSLGLGFVGKLTGNIDIGANAMYLYDSTRYNISAAKDSSGNNPASSYYQQAAIGLPDVTYRQTTYNVFGKLDLNKKEALRLDLIHQRASLSEWTWNNGASAFFYADGTTLTMDPKQEVTFVGLRYSSKF